MRMRMRVSLKEEERERPHIRRVGSGAAASARHSSLLYSHRIPESSRSRFSLKAGARASVEDSESRSRGRRRLVGAAEVMYIDAAQRDNNRRAGANYTGHTQPVQYMCQRGGVWEEEVAEEEEIYLPWRRLFPRLPSILGPRLARPSDIELVPFARSINATLRPFLIREFLLHLIPRLVILVPAISHRDRDSRPPPPPRSLALPCPSTLHA
jgi:hypothetical protein